MKITRVKRLFEYELLEEYRSITGKEPDPDTKFFFSEMDLYYEPIDEKKPAKLRITFPLFLTTVSLILIFGGIKWLFTGNAYLNHKSFVIKQMVRWDKYCRFNIVT